MKRMFFVLALLAGCGAQQVNVAPLQIKPIHITVDVNLHDSKTDQHDSKTDQR